MALILFDFDGVLADTQDDMIRFAQETCNELGIDHTVTLKDLSGLEVMSFAAYGRQCEVPENLIDEFVRRCTGKFGEKKSPPAIFDGLGDVVRELSTKHMVGNSLNGLTLLQRERFVNKPRRGKTKFRPKFP